MSTLPVYKDRSVMSTVFGAHTAGGSLTTNVPQQVLTAVLKLEPAPCPPFAMIGTPFESSPPVKLESAAKSVSVNGPSPSIASGQPSLSESKSR